MQKNVKWIAHFEIRGRKFKWPFVSGPYRSVARVDFQLLCNHFKSPVPEGFTLEEAAYV